jgi:hypothetical protein
VLPLLDAVPAYIESNPRPRFLGQVPATLAGAMRCDEAFSELLTNESRFTSVTRSGSNRVFLRQGGGFRVQNIGQRRVRLEATVFFLCDPVVLPLLLDTMVRAYERPPETKLAPDARSAETSTPR